MLRDGCHDPFSRLPLGKWEKVAEGRMREATRTMPTTSTKTLKHARALRRDLTPAEAKLWSALRGRRLGDHKFRRQVPVGPFIADFLCRERMLIVEIDGATHSSGKEMAYDARRTGYLRTHGFRVLRILNDDVYRQLDNVLDGILLALDGEMPD